MLEMSKNKGHLAFAHSSFTPFENMCEKFIRLKITQCYIFKFTYNNRSWLIFLIINLSSKVFDKSFFLVNEGNFLYEFRRSALWSTLIIKVCQYVKKIQRAKHWSVRNFCEKFFREWRLPSLKRFFTKHRQFLQIIHTTFSFLKSFTLNFKIQIFTATQSIAILWKQILFVLNFL